MSDDILDPIDRPIHCDREGCFTWQETARSFPDLPVNWIQVMTRYRDGGENELIHEERYCSGYCLYESAEQETPVGPEDDE